MGNCGCGGHAAGAGPFAEGRELVDFVSRAHGGGLRNKSLPVGLSVTCQGCGAAFTMATFVDSCPACGGVHAVSPPRANDPANIQYAGAGYILP